MDMFAGKYSYRKRHYGYFVAGSLSRAGFPPFVGTLEIADFARV
jgi:hypothetical protein